MLARVAVVFRRLRTPRGREERNIHYLLLHTTVFGVVNGGAITFLPVLLVRLNASEIEVSLLTALPALATIVAALPAGVLVKRWRHLVCNSARCFYIMRLCYLPIMAAFVLVPAQAPLLIVVIWGLAAIPATLGNVVFYDILAEAVSPRRRPAVNGTRWALLGLVTALSVAGFGELLEALTWPTNYVLVFAISFAMGLLTTYFYSRIEVPARKVTGVAADNWPQRPALKDLLKPLMAGGSFTTLLAVTFVLRLGCYLPSGLYSIFWVRNLGASDAWIGWRSTIESIALTIGYYFWGRVTSRRGYRPVVVASALGISLAPLITGMVTQRIMDLLFGVALIAGFFASGIEVSLFEWLLTAMPPDERPRYVAVNTALVNLVAFAGPIVGATVSHRVGIPPVLFAAAACLMLSGILAYAMAHPRLARKRARRTGLRLGLRRKWTG